MLLARGLAAQDASWVAGSPSPSAVYGGKTRYRQADAACRTENPTNGEFGLLFEAPQWAVTPGQSAVLYSGEVCLGGGIIRAAIT